MIFWLLACSPTLTPDTLPPCGGAPNCVTSQEGDAAHTVPPLPVASPAALREAVLSLPGCVVVSETERWLHAACTTPSGLFTDDLLVLRLGDLLHVRSASRVGYSDLGVNRERVEALRVVLDPEAPT